MRPPWSDCPGSLGRSLHAQRALMVAGATSIEAYATPRTLRAALRPERRRVRDIRRRIGTRCLSMALGGGACGVRVRPLGVKRWRLPDNR
jgi:hypothetical protein